ncbi:MAG TPA: hypothetical protein VD794_13675, partial [Flavisolibacter sp.]|nr:hypothetical protein [Flavisolibacter sp.]
NIVHFKRHGDTGSSAVTVMDDLVYGYNGNQLVKVNEHSTGTPAYGNYLNLPEEVIINGNTISYGYTASGAKIQKTASGVTTHYIGGIHYKGNDIDFIQTAEGRIFRSVGTGQYSYEYHLTDHLGNVRISFKKEPFYG